MSRSVVGFYTDDRDRVRPITRGGRKAAMDRAKELSSRRAEGNALSDVRAEVRAVDDFRDLDAVRFEVDDVTWKADPDVPVFQSAIVGQGTGQEKYDIDLVMMEIDDFIDSQIGRFEQRDLRGMTPRQAYLRGRDMGHVREMAREMRRGTPFPVPIVEYDENGDLYRFQEGRHRGEAVKHLGNSRIPVWVARQCPVRGCGDRDY